MTSHELAKALLEYPDLEVRVYSYTSGNTYILDKNKPVEEFRDNYIDINVE